MLGQDAKEENINENKKETKFEEAPIYQEVKTKEKEIRTDSYFDGGVLELIGWRILAFIITVATFGIANPWAQCMLYSWQMKHTVYNGKRLKFEGTGGDLFVNMFKWIFFSIITLGIYILFIPIKKAKWVLSNIHYEDEPLVKGESYFDGHTIQFIGINILTKIVTFLSFGILYPFAMCIKLKWINKHSIINRKKIVFDGNGFQLWGKYILWCFLTIITLGIFGFWLPIRMLKWQTKHVHIKTIDEQEKKDHSILIIAIIAIILVIVASCILINLKIDFSGDNFEEIAQNVVNSITGKKIELKNDELMKEYQKYKKLIGEDKISKEEIDEFFRNRELMDMLMEEGNEELINEAYRVLANRATDGTFGKKEKVEKQTINAGGYTLTLGIYEGQIEQGVWDDETMTSTSVYHDVVLALGEDTITLDGQTYSYSISGTELKLSGMDFKILEATGNNRITYYAETCPELIYQNY